MTDNLQFRELIWDYYHEHGRQLPWRVPDQSGEFDPYKILVSEIMLQQTQVSRVIPKYERFLSIFPNVQTLASSQLADVLAAWVGLGYNRRAKFLWQAARMVSDQFDGKMPSTQSTLIALPGVGANTAGAVCAYAYNQPVVFIETNIRTVYIHHFFPEQTGVHDRDLLPLLEATVDQEHPREWYWALMDYGTYLKATVGNASRDSRHFTRQSRFVGSARQIRGEVTRRLNERPYDENELLGIIADTRGPGIIDALLKEQLIRRQDSTLML